MARYAGRKGVVYLSTSGSGTAASIIGLDKWSLNMPTDKIEVTAFGDGNKTYVQGLPDVDGQISGWWDDTDDNLYDASRSTSAVKMYLYPSSDVTTKYWYGTAWVDFSIQTDVKGAPAVSGSFKGASTWGQM